MANVNGKSDMTPTESETTRTVGNFSHGSRETPVTSTSSMDVDRSEKARCHHPDMHVAGESDSSIVPKKPANKGGVPSPAELVEGRGLTKENTEQSLLDRTQSRNSDGNTMRYRATTIDCDNSWTRSKLCGSTFCGDAANVDAT